MDPFKVMELRGHVLETERQTFVRHTSHSGPNDDYNLATGPSRSGTARTDKALTARDLRMPGDLMRSRRVGLSKNVCMCCGEAADQGVLRHRKGCVCTTPELVGARMRLTTGPMLSNETSADTGWR